MFKKFICLSFFIFRLINLNSSEIGHKINIDDAKTKIYLEFENAKYELLDQLANNMLKLMGFNESGLNEAGEKQLIDELTINIVINGIIEELARAKTKKIDALNSDYIGDKFSAASGSSENARTIACPVCTFHNSPSRTNCEICETNLTTDNKAAAKATDVTFTAPAGSLTSRLLRK